MIELADLDAVCETIALTVGLGEDAISLDEGLNDLTDVGSTSGPVVSKALATISAARGTMMISVSLDNLDGPTGNLAL